MSYDEDEEDDMTAPSDWLDENFGDEITEENQSLEEIYSTDVDNSFSEIYKHHTNGTCEESNLICKDCDQLFNSEDIIFIIIEILIKKVELIKHLHH